MSKIYQLTLRGYKSIRELEDFDLRNLNILIGANGAGKSNFIGFFRLVNAMYQQQLQLYVQKQGGPDALLYFGRKETESIQAEIYFKRNGYRFNLSPTNDNRLIFENEYSWFGGYWYPSNSSALLGQGHEESQLKNAKDIYSPYVRRALESWRVYHFHDTSESAKVKQKHASNDNLQFKTDAANLAAYLRKLYEEYPDEYQRIVETIRLALPSFADFVHRPGDAEYIELEWIQVGHPDTPLKAHMLSDGSLRFICLATLLLQPVELLPDTILIDEPELGLHPYAIVVLADIIKQVAEEKQLIISTQSVELINEFSPEDIIVADQEDDASVFKRLSREALDSWLEEYTLGELWKQNVFGGRP